MGIHDYHREPLFGGKDNSITFQNQEFYNVNPTSDSFVSSLAIVLNQLISMSSPSRGRITTFHASRVPETNIKDYLERIAKYFGCSNECFVLSFVYIDRIVKVLDDFNLSILNIHRLIMTSVMLAAKFFDDIYYSNAFYARIGGVKTKEINVLEAHFLNLINYQLFVNPLEYDHYRANILATVATNSFTRSPILLAQDNCQMCHANNNRKKNSHLHCCKVTHQLIRRNDHTGDQNSVRHQIPLTKSSLADCPNVPSSYNCLNSHFHPTNNREIIAPDEYVDYDNNCTHYNSQDFCNNTVKYQISNVPQTYTCDDISCNAVSHKNSIHGNNCLNLREMNRLQSKFNISPNVMSPKFCPMHDCDSVYRFAPIASISNGLLSRLRRLNIISASAKNGTSIFQNVANADLASLVNSSGHSCVPSQPTINRFRNQNSIHSNDCSMVNHMNYCDNESAKQSLDYQFYDQVSNTQRNYRKSMSQHCLDSMHDVAKLGDNRRIITMNCHKIMPPYELTSSHCETFSERSTCDDSECDLRHAPCDVNMDDIGLLRSNHYRRLKSEISTGDNDNINMSVPQFQRLGTGWFSKNYKNNMNLLYGSSDLSFHQTNLLSIKFLTENQIQNYHSNSY